MMRKLLTFFILSLFTAGCSSAGPPAWYLKGSHPRYQDEFYFVGMGSGGTFGEAQLAAAASIAKQIEVKVESRLEIAVESYAADDREIISSEVKSFSRAISERKLAGVQAAEQYVDNGTYYVLCVVDKDKFAEGLLQDIGQKAQSLNGILKDSGRLLNEGKIFPALRTMMQAVDISAEYHAGVNLYTSITGKNIPLSDITTGPEILSRARSILAKLTLIKVSGDDQYGKSGQLLPEPFTVKAVYKSDTGDKIPAPELALNLKDENNKILDSQLTDNNGLAEFWAYAIGQDKSKLIVTLNLKKTPPAFKKDLQNLQTTFRYNIMETAPITFSIRIYDKHDRRIETVEAEIAKSVEKCGHHIGENAPFRLTGKMNLVESHEIDGFDGKQFMAKTEVILFMEMADTGGKIGSVTITAKGLDKTSEKRAVEKSYQRLEISSRDMAKMLAEAEGRLKEYNEKQSKEALEMSKVLYGQGEYRKALFSLAKVNEGDENIREREKLFYMIKDELNKNTEIKTQD
ncbi:LPP20 family lipoprotein [bacterium]|nr:LPP20 family lipoprotein [FCB group bacterium]MBL7190903.1 LPP20 family lipoprotein [bacterium]